MLAGYSVDASCAVKDLVVALELDSMGQKKKVSWDSGASWYRPAGAGERRQFTLAEEGGAGAGGGLGRTYVGCDVHDHIATGLVCDLLTGLVIR
ncbi:hypothetical protein GN244_ATG09044 [Phytophthora infestans]|uniref:Uncharacterized protein n=1 Tax=Phytophthora infestans TaxID=4787 RepID=A0A833WV94_PHYIN|nr:hypothetical protein GN244_ATG09044 [Phytophthora infestans]KAF4132551.1 hypothetical protein GN958_ATG18281 [Phytophthora infestans]